MKVRGTVTTYEAGGTLCPFFIPQTKKNDWYSRYARYLLESKEPHLQNSSIPMMRSKTPSL